jgi:hypothetical protein
MKPIFFFHKIREVKSFLKIMSARLSGNNRKRIEGVNEALRNMKDEKQVYLDERKAAKEEEERHRDISAI